MQKMFEPKKMSALDARYEAQKIAFAPVVFQCAVQLLRSGLLQAIADAGATGLSTREASAKVGLTEYACAVLMETALSASMLSMENERYQLADVGYFLLKDDMTRVNLDFIEDVCYRPLAHLGASLAEARPAGLKEIGPWATVYEGLSQLPPRAQKSWLDFDHYYSDGAFSEALPHLFAKPVAKLLDFGGNTGKWAMRCMRYNSDVEVTIADLAGQIEMARKNVAAAGFASRFHTAPVDFLNPDNCSIPTGFDVVWMSQFLVCFPEDVIVRILTLAKKALKPGGRILIMDTFWDEQRVEIAAYCLINTSPYFTCVANGTSKMYRLSELRSFAAQAGLEVEMLNPRLGLAHSLVACTPSR
jgi:ubiquinone/menaquinone biosynthesis C-methylase UbiE